MWIFVVNFSLREAYSSKDLAGNIHNSLNLDLNRSIDLIMLENRALFFVLAASDEQLRAVEVIHVLPLTLFLALESAEYIFKIFVEIIV